MIKKLTSFILCLALAVGGCIGLTSCSESSSHAQTEITQQDVINEIVDAALNEMDCRIDDYIDVSYFANLDETSQVSTNTSIKKLTASSTNDTEAAYIDVQQYNELTSSIDEIFSELTDEEYKAIKSLADNDDDIAKMLNMIENDFEGYEYESEEGGKLISASNVMLTSAAAATIGSILLSQGVNGAAVVAIKGAFNTMIATLKAFFLTTSIKAVIITAAILVIATVVIINWNKIKPVFTKIVNVFVENSQKLASTVTKVFNKIFNQAVSAAKTICSSIDDLINNESSFKNRLLDLKKTVSDVKNVIKTFLGIKDLSNLYDTNNKVLCIGRDNDKTYKKSNDISGYQNYANKYGYWSFFVSDYDTQLKKFGQKLISYANELLVTYCCIKDWDFILVTNPYYYMQEHLSTKYGGTSYANEISIIRKHDYNTFLVGPASWSLVPYPGNTEGSYFAYAGYKVSK